MKRILPFLLILAVLAAALGSAWYLTRTIPASTPATVTNPPGGSGQPSGLQGAATQPVADKGAPGAEPAHTHGPANAPAQLEEFGDFQCPPCALFHPILEQMEEEFGDKLRVTFRQFPLVPSHRHALIAASASEAAGMQGKFWQMHKLLYDHQKDWKDAFDSRPIFEGYAKQIGLDIDRYKRDMESDAVARRITADGRRGYSLGVKGTPTVFLNGREVPFESLPAERLRVLIQKEIDSKK
jgi:protein-disulfide isomerase